MLSSSNNWYIDLTYVPGTTNMYKAHGREWVKIYCEVLLWTLSYITFIFPPIILLTILFSLFSWSAWNALKANTLQLINGSSVNRLCSIIGKTHVHANITVYTAKHIEPPITQNVTIEYICIWHSTNKTPKIYNTHYYPPLWFTIPIPKVQWIVLGSSLKYYFAL